MPGGEEGRFDHFMSEQFMPFLDTFRKHLEADDRRFELMGQAVNRISSTLEVQTALAAAFAKKTEDVLSKRNAIIAIFLAALSPAVAIAIALWK